MFLHDSDNGCSRRAQLLHRQPRVLGLCARSLRPQLAVPVLWELCAPCTNLPTKQRHRAAKLPSQLQRNRTLAARHHLCQQPTSPRQLVQSVRHLHPEPANLPSQQRSQNRKLPSGLRRAKRLHAPKHLPRPVRHARLGPVELSERLMHQVSHQPHEPAVPGQPYQPHQCPRHPERICDCPGACADDDGDASRSPSGDALGIFPASLGSSASERGYVIRCPITGTSCTNPKCGEWCAGSGSRSEADIDWGFAPAAEHHRIFNLSAGVA
jgi:hypothetical protein